MIWTLWPALCYSLFFLEFMCVNHGISISAFSYATESYMACYDDWYKTARSQLKYKKMQNKILEVSGFIYLKSLIPKKREACFCQRLQGIKLLLFTVFFSPKMALSVFCLPNFVFPLQHHHPVFLRAPWRACWKFVLAVRWLWTADHKLHPKPSACGREGTTLSLKTKGKLKKITERLPNGYRSTSSYHQEIDILNPKDATAICAQESRENNWPCSLAGRDGILALPC